MSLSYSDKVQAFALNAGMGDYAFETGQGFLKQLQLPPANAVEKAVGDILARYDSIVSGLTRFRAEMVARLDGFFADLVVVLQGRPVGKHP